MAPRALLFGVSPGLGRPASPRSCYPLPTTWSHPVTAQNDRKHPAPHALAEQLVGCDTGPRVPVALTQSCQQEGLAPFLRLGPLFVAGPEQGLEPGPG